MKVVAFLNSGSHENSVMVNKAEMDELAEYQSDIHNTLAHVRDLTLSLPTLKSNGEVEGEMISFGDFQRALNEKSYIKMPLIYSREFKTWVYKGRSIDFGEQGIEVGAYLITDVTDDFVTGTAFVNNSGNSVLFQSMEDYKEHITRYHNSSDLRELELPDNIDASIVHVILQNFGNKKAFVKKYDYMESVGIVQTDGEIAFPKIVDAEQLLLLKGNQPGYSSYIIKLRDRGQ